jgi:hypothetical protein
MRLTPIGCGKLCESIHFNQKSNVCKIELVNTNFQDLLDDCAKFAFSDKKIVC